MTTVKEKSKEEELNRISKKVSDVNGTVLKRRDSITDDIRDLSTALIGGDSRMIHRGLCKAVVEMKTRVSQLRVNIAHLETLRDAVNSLIPEEHKD